MKEVLSKAGKGNGSANMFQATDNVVEQLKNKIVELENK